MSLAITLAVIAVYAGTPRRSSGPRRNWSDTTGGSVRMAHTDALTNLPNRRSVEEELEVTVDCSDKEGCERGVAIAVGYLDNLKRVNDNYGHNCGDEVLKEIALRINRSIRNHDFLGRWGGRGIHFHTQKHH